MPVLERRADSSLDAQRTARYNYLMTVTITIPADAEKPLQDEAVRAGVSVPLLLEQVVAGRFSAHAQDNSLQELFDRIARPASDIDASREGIYADF
jgi:hypothetical protein